MPSILLYTSDGVNRSPPPLSSTTLFPPPLILSIPPLLLPSAILLMGVFASERRRDALPLCRPRRPPSGDPGARKQTSIIRIVWRGGRVWHVPPHSPLYYLHPKNRTPDYIYRLHTSIRAIEKGGRWVIKCGRTERLLPPGLRAMTIHDFVVFAVG